MPTYEIRAPNGRTYQIDGPVGATDAQVRAKVLEQHPDAGQAVSAPKPRTLGDYVGMGTRAISEGVGDIVSMGSALAVAPTLINLAMGRPAFGQAAASEIDKGSDRRGLAKPRTNNERLASQAIRGATTAVPMLMGGGPLAAAPVRQIISSGAGYAAGEAARQSGVSEVGQAGAALAGGLATFGGMSALTSFARPRVLSQVARDAADLKIPLIPADTGGTGTKMVTAISRGGTIGEVPIQQASKRSVNAAQTAVNREAASLGGSDSVVAGGQAAKRGANAFIANSEQRASELLDRVPIHAETPTVTQNTVATLDDVTKGLQSNEALSKIWTSDARLQKSLDALRGTTKEVPTGILDQSGNPVMRTVSEGGSLNWADMKDFRSRIGAIIGKPSLASEGPDIAAMRRLYGGLTRDMEATASQQGPRALTAFRRYNQYYRGRQSRIENVLKGILGDGAGKSDESAFRQINSWAQDEGGNFKALAQTLRSMPADEANTVRGTVLSRLGRATPGAQSAEGDVFSPATFGTNWNKLSPRGKAVLFATPEHRAAVDKIARVLSAMKGASAYANTSKTALVIGGGSSILHAILSPITGVPILAGEVVLGMVLSSRRVANLLAKSRVPTTASGQAAMQNTIRSLIVAEPLLRDELTAIGRAVANFANDNSTARLAADPSGKQQQEQQAPPQP